METEAVTHDLRRVSALTGIRKSSLWPFVKSGELKSFFIGRKRYVRHTDLMDFVGRMEAKDSEAQETAAEKATA